MSSGAPIRPSSKCKRLARLILGIGLLSASATAQDYSALLAQLSGRSWRFAGFDVPRELRDDELRAFDSASWPMLIEYAIGSDRMTARYARSVLLGLLPQTLPNLIDAYRDGGPERKNGIAMLLDPRSSLGDSNALDGRLSGTGSWPSRVIATMPEFATDQDSSVRAL